MGRLEPVVFGHALARLGLPEKLVHLLLFTVRQIRLLHQEYQRMDQAMRVRAFRPRSNRHTWNSYGWLIGMLLVRSLGRSQRIMGAMRCRGFHGRLYLLDTPVWGRGDTATAAALGFILAALVGNGPACMTNPLMELAGVDFGYPDRRSCMGSICASRPGSGSP